MAVVLDLVNNPRPRHPERRTGDSSVLAKPTGFASRRLCRPLFRDQKIMRDNGLHTV